MAGKEGDIKAYIAEHDAGGKNIDLDTFEQILEMDEDDDDREFSKGIVFGFFDQTEDAFAKMDAAVKEEANHESLDTLSKLGHFLKGSSATLGLTKVKDACEKIQHYGSFKKENGEPDDAAAPKALQKKIAETILDLKTDYAAAEKLLRGSYEQ